MKKLINTTLGILGAIGFLCAGTAILAWDIGQLRQAKESRNWPQIEGTVTLSEVDRSQKESRPHVEYTYVVDGTSYTSRQISFDVFDKPGGEGRLETIVERYPVGRTVAVYHAPNLPAKAILEPEVYSPFLMPLFFGVMFVASGAYILWTALRQVVKRQPAPRPGFTPKRRLAATAMTSGLVYLVIVLTSFESAARETFVKTFGDHPFGIPNHLFVPALQTVLYLPMPWVFWHVMELVFQALQDGRRVSTGHFVGYLVTVGHIHPHLRRSQRVCVVGLAYFAVICAAWIALAAARGI